MQQRRIGRMHSWIHTREEVRSFSAAPLASSLIVHLVFGGHRTEAASLPKFRRVHVRSKRGSICQPSFNPQFPPGHSTRRSVNPCLPACLPPPLPAVCLSVCLPLCLSICHAGWLARGGRRDGRTEDRPRLMFPTKLQPFLQSSSSGRSLIGLTSLSLLPPFPFQPGCTAAPHHRPFHSYHRRRRRLDGGRGSSQQRTPEEGGGGEAVKTLRLSSFFISSRLLL